ncbi:MAG TPA: GTP cyclohydrolase I FolE [Caulobacteraceae bacterium]
MLRTVPALEDLPQAPDTPPTRAEAEAAVRTLIRWAGDDPRREGLRDTPARVAKAYREWFSGYGEDPLEILERTFAETGGYADMVLLKDIPVKSFCEHHMAAIRGLAHVAYLPSARVVGISKLARLVETLSRRLQIQERLTTEIAAALETALKPRGVAVAIVASHDCMASRGVNTPGVGMVTKHLTGAFESGPLRAEFLSAARL